MHELATTNRKQRQKKVLETGTSALYDYKGRPDKLNIALRISISTQRVIENSPLLVFQHRQIKEDKEKTFRKEKQEESTKKQEGLRQKPFIGVCPCQTNKVDGEPSFLSFQVRPLSSTFHFPKFVVINISHRQNLAFTAFAAKALLGSTTDSRRKSFLWKEGRIICFIWRFLSIEGPFTLISFNSIKMGRKDLTFFYFN